MKKGNASLYIIFIFLAVTMVMLFAFATSVNSVLLANLMLGADQILLNTNNSINDINNAAVKTAVQGALSTSKAAGIDTYETNNNLYRFGWIFFLIIATIVIYLLASPQASRFDISGLV